MTPDQHGKVIELGDVPGARPEVRSRMRRAIGDELIATIRRLDQEVKDLIDRPPDEDDTVWLHPATTARDPVWLEIERAMILGPVLHLIEDTDAGDNAWIGRLRSRLTKQLPILERASVLLVELSRFQDSDVGRPSALNATRQAVAASVHAFRAAVETLVAEPAGESAGWLLGVDQAMESWNRAHNALVLIETFTYDGVSPEDIAEYAFGAPPVSAVGAVENTIAAFRDVDPYAPQNYRPSRHFHIPLGEEPRDLRRGDRILVFAERQLRSIGMPAPPLDIETVHDCFQLGWRLCQQECPTLAHISARQTAMLLAAAWEQDPDATAVRVRRFQFEDAPLIIEAAPRADEDMARSADEPIMVLSGHRRLLEGVVRPWLRFVLDLVDVSTGRLPRALPATVSLGPLLTNARTSIDGSLLMALLLDPIAPALRNAEGHERALIGLDGLIDILGDCGEATQRVPVAEVRGRFAALRSAFAGVDCATTVLLHAIGLEVPEGVELRLTPTSLERIVRIEAMAHEQPTVVRGNMEGDTFIIEVEDVWADEIARRTSEGLGRLVSELQGVVFRSPERDARYPTR